MKNPFNFYERLLPINNERKNAFEKLKGFSIDDSLVSLNTLRSLKIGEWHYTRDKKTKFKLIELTNKEAIFITIMEAGASFSLHEHDCTEKGIVVEGHLIDDLNHLKVKKDENWIYVKGVKHKPYCLVRSVYEVTFME